MATPPAPNPSRPWAELQHDLLVAIMARVGAIDLVSGGAARACSAWRAAARDPLAWRRLDLRDWAALTSSRRAASGAGGERMDVQSELASVLEVAAARAAGRVEAVLLPDFADEDHLLLLSESSTPDNERTEVLCTMLECLLGRGLGRRKLDWSPNLLYFSLPTTCITFDQFCTAVGKLRSLKGMAVDESLISYEVLLHVHQCCPDFVELKVFALYVDEEMASTICSSLPRLKKLEIANSDLSGAALMTFLNCLEELEYLDISGYATSAISDVLLSKASRLKVFLWSSRYELGEYVDCSNCGEHFNPQEPCQCMVDQKMMQCLAGPSQIS